MKAKQQQQEYYHIGNAGSKLGPNANLNLGKQYNQKKEGGQQQQQKKNKMAGAALPSLSKTTVKPGKEDELDEPPPTVGLANLMVTTQYKIARKAQKEPQPLMLPADKDKFSP